MVVGIAANVKGQARKDGAEPVARPVRKKQPIRKHGGQP